VSWLDENPNCDRTYASFRLVGDSLDPNAATRALKLQPTLARAKGQELLSNSGRPPRRQRTAVWLLSTDDVIKSTSLERHLRHLLDALEPSAWAIRSLLSEETVRADFFCYWVSATGHGGPQASPGTLSRIGALNASLGFDFYGADEPEASAVVWGSGSSA
jgi:hypothetical protein